MKFSSFFAGGPAAQKIIIADNFDGNRFVQFEMLQLIIKKKILEFFLERLFHRIHKVNQYGIIIEWKFFHFHVINVHGLVPNAIGLEFIIQFIICKTKINNALNLKTLKYFNGYILKVRMNSL